LPAVQLKKAGVGKKGFTGQGGKKKQVVLVKIKKKNSSPSPGEDSMLMPCQIMKRGEPDLKKFWRGERRRG